jgi:hypothetical protein
MLIGIIGAPNKGKSTLFSALTLNEVEIASYPFTTIKPNFGIAYARKQCAETTLGIKCNPRNSLCIGGMRLLPINVIDVAGLVEDAHKGRGMGNQFLNDLSQSDALILVVDASGLTDKNGNPSTDSDPCEEVNAIKKELQYWIAQVIMRHMPQISRKNTDMVEVLSTTLSSFHLGNERIDSIIDSLALPKYGTAWSEEDAVRFAAKALELGKPIMIVANKSDSPHAAEALKRLREAFGENVAWCSAAMELALRKAAKGGIIDYTPGSKTLRLIKTDISAEQLSGIKMISGYIEKEGTNVQNVINYAAFNLLDNIVVYPVEDEHRLADSSGNVLPDAILLKRGSTAKDLAFKIHTDIGKNMLYAVDVRAKMRIGKDHVLKDNDVIRIVSAAKAPD